MDASGNTVTCSFTVTTFDVCVQDDSNPSTALLWNSATGAYRFCCSGTIYTGTGTVVRQGCIFTFTRNAVDRRVAGTAVGQRHIDAHRREENAAVTIIDVNRQSNQIIPAMDLSLGIRYCHAGWTFGAGYEWTNWFGAASPLEFSDSFNGGTLAPSGRDLGLDGWFLSATFDF